MAHSRDQEMMRLHNRIDVLEKENRMLRSVLLDAIGITDAALAEGGERREEKMEPVPLFRSGARKGLSARYTSRGRRAMTHPVWAWRRKARSKPGLEPRS
jgi:hypothetical protein